MPAMPRSNNKGKKISYKIIGPPENLTDKESTKQKKVKEELLIEEGQWAR